MCMLLQSDSVLYFYSYIDEMDDYIPVSQTFTFHNERQKCVYITIIDDAFLERPVEMFKLTLTRTKGLNGRIQLSPDEGVIEITENDGKNCNMILYRKLGINILVIQTQLQ